MTKGESAVKELEIITGLDFPHIVKYCDHFEAIIPDLFGVQVDHLCIVSEFCEVGFLISIVNNYQTKFLIFLV